MKLDKEEISKILRDHYPNHTVDVEEIHLLEDENLGNFIVLKGNGGKKVIYQLEGDKVVIYKPQSLKESDVGIWKSIFRDIKLNILGIRV